MELSVCLKGENNRSLSLHMHMVHRLSLSHDITCTYIAHMQSVPVSSYRHDAYNLPQLSPENHFIL